MIMTGTSKLISRFFLNFLLNLGGISSNIILTDFNSVHEIGDCLQEAFGIVRHESSLRAEIITSAHICVV